MHTVFVKLVDDVNYMDATSATLTVNVAKVTLNISAIANNITYGQDLVVSHVLNVGDAVGSVVYFVDGKRVGNSSVGSSINVSALSIISKIEVIPGVIKCFKWCYWRFFIWN